MTWAVIDTRGPCAAYPLEQGPTHHLAYYNEGRHADQNHDEERCYDIENIVQAAEDAIGLSQP
jgi:hypothetical protein